MNLTVSPLISQVESPPIAEAMSWVRQGPRNRVFLNLCQAVPSYPPAESLQQELARLAQLPHMGGYTDSFGLPALRAAHGTHLGADYGASISGDHIAITTGCNQAFAASVMALAKAGDQIILPAPFYFNHQMWLTMLGIGITAIPAFAPGRPFPSVEEAEAAITPATRAIVLCTPNNPTGAIYPRNVLMAFYRMCQRRGIALIVDETYKDFRPFTEPAHDIFQDADWPSTFIQLYSFSKIYALAGYRLGSIAASPDVLREVVKILDCMTICPPAITQEGVGFALKGLGDWKSQKLGLMAGRLAALRRGFERPGLRYVLESSGAYFAYVRHPFGAEPAKSVAMRLAQEFDVLCLPGSMFGPGQDEFLRFAFANVDEALMEPLVDRLMESQG